MAVRTKGFQGSHIISFTDKSCPHCVEATEALDGLEAKLTSSRQFSDLKRQLQKKNELVSDLRARLRRAGLDDDALTADDRVRR